MPYCTGCGAEIDEDDEFCTSCGEPVDGAGSDGTDGAVAETDASIEPEPAGDTAGSNVGESGTDGTAKAESTADERTEPTDAETRGRLVAASGSGLTAVGAFLPWISITILGTTATKNGIDGDGVFTLGFALVAGIALLVGKGSPWSKKSRGLVLVLGALSALVGLAYISDPALGADVSESAAELFEPEIGLYLTAIGGLLMSAGPLYATFGES